jgi:hypothetical protein
MALDIEACVPPIRLSEVGAWVEQRAGDSLGARAATLAAIERAEAHDDLMPTNSLGGVEARRSVRPGDPDALASSGERPHTEFAATVARDPGVEISVASVQSKIVAARQRKPRTALWAAVTFIVVLGSGTLLLMHKIPGIDLAPAAHSTPTVEQAPEPQPQAAPPVLQPAAPLPSVQPSAAASWEHATPTPSASTLSTPPKTTWREPAHGEPPATRPPRTKPQPPSSHCDPPYTIDSLGIQHFKPECM